MSTLQIIQQKLQTGLNPVAIEVLDESNQHIGHAGARDGGQTHFAVTVISEKFSGLSRVQRHKVVYSLLVEELKGGVHALRINAFLPGEV
jgi:BolA protein